MKLVKKYEDFKVNNITEKDVMDCIRKGGKIYSSIVKEYPENDPKKPLTPKDISENGEITVELDGEIYTVDLDDVERIESEVISESKKVSMVDPDFKNHVPKKLTIVTSNGEFELELKDCWVQFPKVMLSYWHSTPLKTGDVLADGEPDYLSFDLNFVKNGKNFEINVENTYGDAMMFEYKIKPPNNVSVGHYNGYKSKFDPMYVFTYTEKSIRDLMDFFNRFTFGLNLTRDRFNFLDADPDSFKMEKLHHKLVMKFGDFSN